jgi:hypothetical protein
LVYCYPHGYWVDGGTIKDLPANMMKTLNTEFDCQWALNQINWVKTTYNTLFDTTRMRKQELTSSTGSVNQSAYGSVNAPVISDSVNQSACDSVNQSTTDLDNQSAYASANQHSYASAI